METKLYYEKEMVSLMNTNIEIACQLVTASVAIMRSLGLIHCALGPEDACAPSVSVWRVDDYLSVTFNGAWPQMTLSDLRLIAKATGGVYVPKSPKNSRFIRFPYETVVV